MKMKRKKLLTTPPPEYHLYEHHISTIKNLLCIDEVLTEVIEKKKLVMAIQGVDWMDSLRKSILTIETPWNH